MHVDRAHLHPERRSNRLNRAPLADPGWVRGIPYDRRSHHARVPQRLLTLIPGAAELPLPNPELPEQSHVADSMLHDLITAILVAIAAVIASGLLDRIWDTL